MPPRMSRMVCSTSPLKGTSTVFPSEALRRRKAFLAFLAGFLTLVSKHLVLPCSSLFFQKLYHLSPSNHEFCHHPSWKVMLSKNPWPLATTPTCTQPHPRHTSSWPFWSSCRRRACTSCHSSRWAHHLTHCAQPACRPASRSQPLPLPAPARG